MSTQDELFAQLRHPNPNLQERAMRSLAETADETTIPRLMALLGEADIAYRRAAVKALGVIGPAAVPVLAETLQTDANPTVRASCSKALAQVATNHGDQPFPEVGQQALKAAMQDPDPVVHITAVMALGAIGKPVLDLLIEAVRTTDNPALAVAIINALGSLGDPQAKAVLTELSESETVDAYVRESAASALPRLEQVRQYRAAGW